MEIVSIYYNFHFPTFVTHFSNSSRVLTVSFVHLPLRYWSSGPLPHPAEGIATQWTLWMNLNEHCSAQPVSSARACTTGETGTDCPWCHILCNRLKVLLQWTMHLLVHILMYLDDSCPGLTCACFTLSHNVPSHLKVVECIKNPTFRPNSKSVTKAILMWMVWWSQFRHPFTSSCS